MRVVRGQHGYSDNGVPADCNIFYEKLKFQSATWKIRSRYIICKIREFSTNIIYYESYVRNYYAKKLYFL